MSAYGSTPIPRPRPQVPSSSSPSSAADASSSGSTTGLEPILYPIKPRRTRADQYGDTGSVNPLSQPEVEAPTGGNENDAILCVHFSFPAPTSSNSESSNQKVDINDKPVLPDEAKAVMQGLFDEELERGLTYPQHGPLGREGFEAYFLAYDLVIGLQVNSASLGLSSPPAASGLVLSSTSVKSLLDSPTTPWQSSIAFFYYIKPNYPGRSSHLCNAGFVVPPTHRGLGLGGVAGQSFLRYAPALGYRGSVFNLVYANNEASLRIWDRLGFTRVGKIPGAGLLKDGKGGEEYVDAWVIHCDFVERANKEAAESQERP